MPKGGQVYVAVTSDVSGVTIGLEQAKQKTKEYCESSQNSFKSVENSILSVKTALTALAGYGFVQFVEMGGKAEQAAQSFQMVSQSFGINSDALLASLKRTAAGTVSDADIMQKAVKGMIQGLDDKKLNSIMEMARLGARVAGEDISKAFSEIADAIGNKDVGALIKFGLATREEMMLVRQAMRLGITDVDVFSLAMDRFALSQKAFGGALSGNNIETIQRYRTEIRNLRDEFADQLVVALGKSIEGIEEFNKKVHELTPEMQKYMRLTRGGVQGATGLTLNNFGEESWDTKALQHKRSPTDTDLNPNSQTSADQKLQAEVLAQKNAGVMASTLKTELDSVIAQMKTAYDVYKQSTETAMNYTEVEYQKGIIGWREYLTAKEQGAKDDLAVQIDTTQKEITTTQEYYTKIVAAYGASALLHDQANKVKEERIKKVMDLQNQLNILMGKGALITSETAVKTAEGSKKEQEAIDQLNKSTMDYRDKLALLNGDYEESYKQKALLIEAERAEAVQKVLDNKALSDQVQLQQQLITAINQYADAAKKQQENLTTTQGKMTEALKGWVVQNKDGYKAISDGVNTAMSSMTDAIVNFFTTGKIGFSDMIASILKDILKLIVQMEITIPIAQELISLLGGGTPVGGIGGIIGALGLGQGANPTTNLPTGGWGGADFVPAYTAGEYHSGGTVGYSSVPGRVVSSALFATAPRLHKGLHSDEFPAILQRGETVTPKGSGTVSKPQQIGLDISLDQGLIAKMRHTPDELDLIIASKYRTGGHIYQQIKNQK